MLDLQEVFRMATQKVDQDRGALERQNNRQRTAARNRRVSVFATVAVLVAAVLGGFALSRGATQETPADVPPAPAAMANGSMVDIASGEVTPLPAALAAVGTYYAVSPDHSKLAYNACCAQPGPVMVANIDGTGSHPVTATGWDAYGAQWSPDGSLIVYQQRDASNHQFGNLFVVDPLTGRSTQLTDLSGSSGLWFLFPSFAPDGQSVLFHMPKGRSSIFVVDVATGSVTKVAQGGDPEWFDDHTLIVGNPTN